MTGSLEATVTVRREAFTLHAELSVAAGELLAVVGPNGAGKSTLLAALAGLAPLDAGRITVAGRVLDDTASGIQIPTPQRRIGVVFQDYLLFPHLSALDNAAFGPRAAGISRSAARERAAGWLERLGVGELAGRRPRELSGGQAQRVALARALATEPDLLVLDEPLAALDAGTRLAVRTELRQHLASYGAPAVLVTHDPVDALVLGDRLLVLEDGRVAQVGAPAEVARRPRTDYVARLVGRNLYRGEAAGGRVALASGGALTVAAHSVAGPVLVSVRPSSVVVSREPMPGSARNTWIGTVVALETLGDRVRLEITGPPDILADVTPEAVAALRLTQGQPLHVAVKATDIDVYASGAASGSVTLHA